MCANEIEGAEKLARGGVGFSSDNVEATVAPENGNVRFTVTSKSGGEGARRADGFVIAESSFRRLR